MKIKGTLHRTICAAAFLLFSWASFGGAQETAPPAPPFPKEAQALLAKAGTLTSYRARFTLQAKEENGESVTLEGLLLFERPNHRRLELKASGSETASQILVSDGTTEWQYYPASKTVYRVASPAEAPGPHRAFAESQSGSVRFVEHVGQGAQAVSRFEATPLPSVVEGSPVPIQTLRVEVGERDGLVRTLDLLDSKGEAVLSQRYRDVELNVSFPAGTFTFTPPAGAQVVELGAAAENLKQKSK